MDKNDLLTFELDILRQRVAAYEQQEQLRGAHMLLVQIQAQEERNTTKEKDADDAPE